ncbi:hypothetical protein IMY05_C4935000200 [Salix suchowensis]|nr:hypothetical protein IMY05_C4935000200 [Salix suchowensis]
MAPPTGDRAYPIPRMSKSLGAAVRSNRVIPQMSSSNGRRRGRSNRFNSYGISPSEESVTTRSSDKITLFKGTAWILAGVKLGAVETVVGFVTSGGFGVSLTRRVLRMLSRAFIIIGLAKGLDTLEDFELVKLELDAGKLANRQSSQIRKLISNPRLSTFHRLSPSASEFRPNNGAASLTYNDPVPPPQYNTKLQKKSSRSTFAASPMAALTPIDTPTMADFAKLREIESGKRVTIRRANSGVPTLHMRLSSYDLPSPNTVADSIKSRPLSDFYAPHQPSVRPLFPSSMGTTRVMSLLYEVKNTTI